MMSKIRLLILVFFVILIKTKSAFSQNVKLVKFDELNKVINKNSKQTKAVHFWATWCKPCIEELPVLVGYSKKMSNFELILVSLDFKKDIEKLKSFARKNNIKQQILLLDEPDYDSWIDKISPKWSGAIPGTLIVNAKKRNFYQVSFDKDSFEKTLKHYF